jgi:hypothetical protein
MNLHSEINRQFRDWKDCNDDCYEGILLCTGPSLKRLPKGSLWFFCTPVFGVNEAIYSGQPLDYLFVQDTKPGHAWGYANKSQDYNSYKGLEAKFAGKAPYIHALHTIPYEDINEHNWTPYEIGREGLCEFQKDIDTFMLGDGNSVAFSAAQFALYTGIKTLYLVGVDISNPNTIKGEQPVEGWNPYEHWNHKAKWQLFKDWTSVFYPDVKIVSVNPVGLKGMFEEIEI